MSKRKFKQYSLIAIQQLTNEEFRQLDPAERLRINVILQKEFWGNKYNSQSLKGMKVIKIGTEGQL